MSNIKKYLIVFLGSLFYCYEFFIRVSPSAITDILMSHFDVKAGAFATMVAAFFYAYMPMQMFAGVIGDKYGVKRVLVFCIALCSLSTLIFVFSKSIWLAGLARFLMGLSASFAYVGPLILAATWLEKKYYSAAAGLIQVLGSFGASLVGTTWGVKLLQDDWQATYIYAAAIGGIMLIIVAMFLQDSPKQAKKTEVKIQDIISATKQMLAKKQTWYIALMGFAFWAPMSIFGELWGARFLAGVEHVSLIIAGSQMKWVWIGVALGGPCWGMLSCFNRNLTTKIAYALSFFSSLAFLYFTIKSMLLMNIILFLFGFACSGQCLSFGFMREYQDNDVMGAAVGFTNMFVISGWPILGPLSGFMLEYMQDEFALSVIDSMKYTFSMLPIFSIIGIIIISFLLKQDS